MKFSSPTLQKAYEQKIIEYISDGMPTIGSNLSTGFRDGYYGRRCKGDQGSLVSAAYAAGVDCRRANYRVNPKRTEPSV